MEESLEVMISIIFVLDLNGHNSQHVLGGQSFDLLVSNKKRLTNKVGLAKTQLFMAFSHCGLLRSFTVVNMTLRNHGVGATKIRIGRAHEQHLNSTFRPDKWDDSCFRYVNAFKKGGDLHVITSTLGVNYLTVIIGRIKGGKQEVRNNYRNPLASRFPVHWNGRIS